MPRLPFTIDAMLLRELGERLVGAAHIALAELVKNAYDADATYVQINVSRDTIEVIDNGHGMDPYEFENYWMRIGSPHKEKQAISRLLGRPLTGSKGVGRLSAQFLAREVTILTTSIDFPEDILIAKVDWGAARDSVDLEKALVRFHALTRRVPYPRGSPNGTRIILTGLNQVWGPKEYKELAREVWPLQPPFAGLSSSPPPERVDGPTPPESFTVHLSTPNQDETRAFEDQMRAILEIWHGRIRGVLSMTEDGERAVRTVVELADGTKRMELIPLKSTTKPLLRKADFEVRIYKLERKLTRGVILSDARDYFQEYGGVHIYDAGFRLPFYGQPESDWLRLEQDHARRISVSEFLPVSLLDAAPRKAMNFLPALKRVFGVVNVNTLEERRDRQGTSADALTISVTRDRLVDNASFQQLTEAVRAAIDYYALVEAQRALDERSSTARTSRPSDAARVLEEIISAHSADIPRDVQVELIEHARGLRESADKLDESLTIQTGMLGALATAGIAALAFEHEIAKQYSELHSVARELRRHAPECSASAPILVLADRIDAWISRAKETRGLFSGLSEVENREHLHRLRLEPFIRTLISQMAPLLRASVQVSSHGVDPQVRLPKGTQSEWTALFQNVILNAVNATLDSDIRQITISTRLLGGLQHVRIEDTGVGVDLSSSEKLFRPFERRLEISAERRQLGLGGTGLGLSIVRMIADSVGAEVRFVRPDAGYKTCLEITWREL